MPKMADPKEMIEIGVQEIFALEQTVKETEEELMKNETFRNFLKMQRVIPDQISAIWKSIEQQMIDAYEKGLIDKTIKGDWGSLTVAERPGWDIDFNVLPNKFYKKVPDTKMISDTYNLEGKAPKGAIRKVTKYLYKNIK